MRTLIDFCAKQIAKFGRISIMILLGVLVIGIGGYLVYALIRPEKF